jgi:hypothetical protein
MNVYTYSEARQNLASLLDQAAREGEVRIQRKDGQVHQSATKNQVPFGSRRDRFRYINAGDIRFY